MLYAKHLINIIIVTSSRSVGEGVGPGPGCSRSYSRTVGPGTGGRARRCGSENGGR